MTLTAQGGNINVVNGITGTGSGGAVNLTSNTGSVNINATVAESGGGGFVNVTSASTIADAGLGFISAPNVKLDSTSGNVNLSSLSATGSLTLIADPTGAGRCV